MSAPNSKGGGTTSPRINMHHITKFLIIFIAVALAACEKHREENTDTSAYHHPLDEKGAPVRSPGPEAPPSAPVKEQGQATPPYR
jgi:hypothetical protein